MKHKIKFGTVGMHGDDTMFRIEQRDTGLWSDEPEIRIVREFKGKPSRYGPSFRLSTGRDMALEIIRACDKLEKLQLTS